MSRIIINYDDDISDANALHYASVVVSMGRMSRVHEKSYCYCTKFKDGTRVFANVTKSGTVVFTMKAGGKNVD